MNSFDGVLSRLPGRGGLQAGLEENCVRGIDRQEERFHSMQLLFFLSANKTDLECQSEELDFVSATL